MPLPSVYTRLMLNINIGFGTSVKIMCTYINSILSLYVQQNTYIKYIYFFSIRYFYFK